MRPVTIAGAALASARGADLGEAVVQLRAQRNDHATRTVPTLDGPRVIPYYSLIHDDSTLIKVCRAALADAALSARDLTLLVGSSSLQIGEAERDAQTVNMRGDINELARRIKSALGLTGADYTVNTACASSAHALLLAHTLIAAGMCQHALIVGIELSNLCTPAGFHAMQLLGSAVRPFDAARDGLVLGDAVAAVVLSAELSPTKPRLLGGANLIDTANPAGADVSGAALTQLMQRALRHSGIDATDVDLIKAHAAGSPANDAAEALALAQTFDSIPPVTSLKGYFGHVLGASGCTELAALLGCWREGFTPGTAGCVTPDPALLLQPLRQMLHGVPRYALLNYVGFGGGQAALVIGNPPP